MLLAIIEAGVASVLETRHRKIQQKSCFIPSTRSGHRLASNQLDESQLSHEDLLEYYTPGQQKVEGGFRFLKDPWFMANTLFLKPVLSLSKGPQSVSWR